MYPPPAFASDRLADALRVAELVRFAVICLVRGDLADLVLAPFIVAGPPDTPELHAHLARANPLRPLLEAGPLRCRLLFQAADGYVSPSVYAEKRRTGRVVPTWNYVAAQFEGELARVPDAELPALLAAQVSAFEADAGSDWHLTDAPPDYAARMARGVFGLRFTPERCTTHRKLSQNKPDEVAAVRAWLAQRAEPARSLAFWMEPPESP